MDEDLKKQVIRLQMDVNEIKNLLGGLVKSDNLAMNRDIIFNDGRNIIGSTATGTMIGTEVGQKFGFWGTPPTIQPSSTAVVPSVGASYDQTQVNKIVTAVNSIISDLRSVGIQASS